jgi:hypothetical protein
MAVHGFCIACLFAAAVLAAQAAEPPAQKPMTKEEKGSGLSI